MAESLQHKLDRVRRPRVQITYDVETNGAMEKKELPFVVGVLADLSAPAQGRRSRPLKDRKFVPIDRDNFNDVLAKAAPRLAMKVQNKLTDEDSKLAVELNFKTMDDFEPARVAEQVPALKELLDMRQRLTAAAEQDGRQRQARTAAGRRAGQHRKGRWPWPSRSESDRSAEAGGESNELLNKPSSRRRRRRDDHGRPRPARPGPRRHQAAERQASSSGTRTTSASSSTRSSSPARSSPRTSRPTSSSGSARSTRSSRPSSTRSCTTPSSRSWKATWRGLHYLVHQSETGEKPEDPRANVKKQELLKDLEKAVEFDQSALFKKVYEEEYGQLGGQPYGMLVGDYEFGRHPRGRQPAEDDLGRGGGGPCAVRRRGRPEDVQHGQLHRAGQPARPGQDFRAASNTPTGSRSANRRIRATSP